MNKIKSFYAKHKTAIKIAGSYAVLATVSYTIATLILQNKERVVVTPDDFVDIDTYNDFKAAWALAEEYDLDVMHIKLANK